MPVCVECAETGGEAELPADDNQCCIAYQPVVVVAKTGTVSQAIWHRVRSTHIVARALGEGCDLTR